MSKPPGWADPRFSTQVEVAAAQAQVHADAQARALAQAPGYPAEPDRA